MKQKKRERGGSDSCFNLIAFEERNPNFMLDTLCLTCRKI